MVGGYVILTKSPLSFGTNNMVPVYGSAEAFYDRLIRIIKSRKPLLAEFYLEGASGIGRAWLEVDLSGTDQIALVSVQVKITINPNNGVIVLAHNS